jgi:hypothetical protein
MLGHPADRLIDRAAAIRLDRLADHGVLCPPVGRHFGHIVGPRPLGGGNALRKCKGELSFRTFAMFSSHVTKCYPVLLNSKNPGLFSLAVPSPGPRLAGTPSKGKEIEMWRNNDPSSAHRHACRTYGLSAFARRRPTAILQNLLGNFSAP